MASSTISGTTTPGNSKDELLQRLLPQIGRLPIFPLQRAQLFPGVVLPLYIFEPRYREMTAACLQAGGAMAVTSLLPGFEEDYEGRPPVRPLCGAGLVVAHRLNQDGTYNLLLHGVARVRIEEELAPEHSYREVRATPLPDRLPPGYDVAGSLRTLMLLLDRLAGHIPEGGEILRSLCDAAAGPGELTDVLSAALVADPDLRQGLLEECDVSVRLEQVTAEIARLLGQVGKPGSGKN